MTQASKAVERVPFAVGVDILDRLVEIAEELFGDEAPKRDAVVGAAQQLAEDMLMDSWSTARREEG